MSSTDVERLEALLISLRDQLDALSERVEARLLDHARGLHRLQAEVAVLEVAVRSAALDAHPSTTLG